MDVDQLGADFLVCAGYNGSWVRLAPGFFWVKSEHLNMVRPGPFYWMAVAGSDNFCGIELRGPQAGAERKALGLTGMGQLFQFQSGGHGHFRRFCSAHGTELVVAHNRELIEFMFERLPKDRCVPASPLDAAQRGALWMLCRAQPGKKLPNSTSICGKKMLSVSLREGNYSRFTALYNTERDIDRLISVITA